MLVEPDVFLNALSRMYDDSKASGGSVTVSMKRHDGKPDTRLSRKGRTGAKMKKMGGGGGDDAGVLDEPVCLVRAALKRKKVSAMVPGKELVRFQMMFTNIMKVKLDGLEKRSKRSSKKHRKKAQKKAN